MKDYTDKIRRGSKVQDFSGDIGIVVDINTWGNIDDLNSENHGTITVWLQDKTNYGDDNCEHYTLFGWERILTVLEY